jgi:hypothetical protein
MSSVNLRETSSRTDGVLAVDSSFGVLDAFAFVET